MHELKQSFIHMHRLKSSCQLVRHNWKTVCAYATEVGCINFVNGNYISFDFVIQSTLSLRNRMIHWSGSHSLFDKNTTFKLSSIYVSYHLNDKQIRWMNEAPNFLKKKTKLVDAWIGSFFSSWKTSVKQMKQFKSHKQLNFVYTIQNASTSTR